LFLRGLPLWLLIVGPIVVALGVLSAQIDWDALSRLMDKADDPETGTMIGKMLAPGIGVAIAAITTSFIALSLLYPVFQAVKLRWWISGLRFGEVAVTSRLRARQVYWVYLRVVLYFLLFGLLTMAFGGALIFAVVEVVRTVHNASLTQIVTGALSLCLYVVVMIGSSTIYQVIVAAGLWRLGVETAALTGEAALDGVRATGSASSALGEGLADALGVGSI
jgi:hypothetical protein